MTQPVLFEWVTQPIIVNALDTYEENKPLPINFNDCVPNLQAKPLQIQSPERFPYSVNFGTNVPTIPEIPATIPCYTMQGLNSQGVTITFNKNIEGGDVIFTIVGEDFYGQALSLEVTVADGTTTQTSAPIYKIFSITPDFLPTEAQLGAITASGTGTLPPFLCDVWNKEALYAYAITNKGTGTLNVTPQFTLSPMPLFVNGINPPSYNPVWFSKGSSRISIELSAAGTTTPPIFQISGTLPSGQSVSELTNFTTSSTLWISQYSYASDLVIEVKTASNPDVNATITANTITLGLFSVGSLGLLVLSQTSFPAILSSIGSYPFPDYPVTAFQFLVNAGNTETFTAAILQQGGKF